MAGVAWRCVQPSVCVSLREQQLRPGLMQRQRALRLRGPEAMGLEVGPGPGPPQPSASVCQPCRVLDLEDSQGYHRHACTHNVNNNNSGGVATPITSPLDEVHPHACESSLDWSRRTLCDSGSGPSPDSVACACWGASDPNSVRWEHKRSRRLCPSDSVAHSAWQWLCVVPSLKCSLRPLPWLWMALLLLCCSRSASASVTSPLLDATHYHNDTIVCQSIDIRNNVANFEKLRNCTVVEGSVQIVLIDNADEKNYTNITFPNLREITGYLILCRVSGLRSLAHMFPNLAIIRGYDLILNYALVIYEMSHMNDVGLVSLVSIMRGFVRIERNPVLCYVDTIDWGYIAPVGQGEEGHFIKGNKPANECPRKCPEECPDVPKLWHVSRANSLIPMPTTHCWTDVDCQKICPEECEKNGCLPDKTCCNKQCLGGCFGPESKDCVSCKGVNLNNLCITKCPANLFKFLDRRCVGEAECRQTPAPVDPKSKKDLPPFPWRPFNDSCLLECPPGFIQEEIRLSDGQKSFDCVKCNGPCAKECTAGMVDNIAASQRLRGCTVITTSLEIQIRGGRNIVKELEENLQSIQEIYGHLKIVRSFPLVSLNFLRNLRVIHGQFLENKAALIVLDNQNLQKLWDWSDNSTFQIKQGSVFFHFNPKLCRKEIETLRIKTNLSEFEPWEVSDSTNGDKVACDMENLNATVHKRNLEAVLIKWNAFNPPDTRTLLGYVVFYIEAPNQDITLYDGRDACGGDGWHVIDVPPTQSDTILTQLKPYTQYAFYVKTYTVAASGSNLVKGAQSKIQYFRTLPAVPSSPKDLIAYSNSSSEMIIKWLPPIYPNGNVTQYIVRGILETEVPDRSSYCHDPPAGQPTEPAVELLPKTTEAPPGEGSVPTTGDYCPCNPKVEVPDNKAKEKETMNEILFEDDLHNTIYVRRDPDSPRAKRALDPYGISDGAYQRYKRSVGLDQDPPRFPDNPEGYTPAVPPADADFEEKLVDGVYHSFERIVTGGTELVMKNLHHFGRYTIKVSACRERDPSEHPAGHNCSLPAVTNQRTLYKESADDIVKVEMKETNSTTGERILTWSPPPNPNGIIVRYDIEILAEDLEKSTPFHFCLPITKTSFIIPRRHPGNYSIRVSATSLWNKGNFTEKLFFIIPEPTTSNLMLIFYVILGLSGTGLVGAVIAIYVRRTWCPPPVPPVKLITQVNPDYTSAYTPDEWEVARENVQLLKELGQGSFGMVYEGIIRNVRPGVPETPCAIKTVNEHSQERDRNEFLNEASVMKAFKTHHVVRLLGVVSQGSPTLVIMELMAKGDLKRYLRRHRPDEAPDDNVQPPTLKQILRMAIEIADGMAYLAAKKFVHRDLAARNCMVAEDMTVKIGDFGMTRDIYETEYYRKGSKGLMPVRWMAPESLKDGVFKSSSDVWSYGVVLWEMATLASQPYQGLSNEEVLRYVKDGGVMEAPENCPEQLYKLMRKCWQFRAVNRPSFLDLVEMLLPDVEPGLSFNARSFYHSQEAQEVRHLTGTGLAPLEEGEVDPDIEAISPETPLRGLHEREESDASESENELAERERIPAPAPSSYAQYHKAYSSDSSRESKASNGSSANVNTANGYIRHGNGATSHTSHSSHSSHHGPPPTLKTTEC